MRISKVLTLNTLCCAIGMLLAWDAWWLSRYPAVVFSLWEGVLRWVAAVVSH